MTEPSVCLRFELLEGCPPCDEIATASNEQAQDMDQANWAGHLLRQDKPAAYRCGLYLGMYLLFT